MSSRDRLFPASPLDAATAQALSSMRGEYRVTIATVVALLLALIFGLVFGLRPADNTAAIATIATLSTRVSQLENATAQLVANISALATTDAQLHVEIMTLMMSTLSSTVRYMQNGTCAFGYPVVDDSAVQHLSDYSDYVILNYTLKEVLLSPVAIPLTVLEISGTPRPIVFNGYTPPVSLPKDNDLQAILAFFDPPIATLDSLATNGFNLAYSYVMASKLSISPNCVGTSLAQHDSNHCTEENGYSPYFTGSYPSPNSVQIFTNNLKVAGDANLEFTWGQWDYTSLGSQYNFVGTTLEFTGPFEMLLPNL